MPTNTSIVWSGFSVAGSSTKTFAHTRYQVREPEPGTDAPVAESFIAVAAVLSAKLQPRVSVGLACSGPGNTGNGRWSSLICSGGRPVTGPLHWCTVARLALLVRPAGFLPSHPRPHYGHSVRGTGRHWPAFGDVGAGRVLHSRDGQGVCGFVCLRRS